VLADSELQGACHCGALRLTLPSRPQKATRCNSSLCRCVGALVFAVLAVIWAERDVGLFH
jgi:hypothetical protein